MIGRIRTKIDVSVNVNEENTFFYVIVYENIAHFGDIPICSLFFFIHFVCLFVNVDVF